MAYCLKLYKEKERLRKSLWELDNKKRRIFHQIVQQPSAQTQSSWKWKYPARDVSLVLPQTKTVQTDKQQKKKQSNKNIKPEISLRRITTSRPDTQQSRLETQQSRLTTQQSDVVQRRASQHKRKNQKNLARPAVPQFLFC